MLSPSTHSTDRLSRFGPWLAFALVVLATFLVYVLLPFQAQVMDSAYGPAAAASLIYEGDLNVTEFVHWNEGGSEGAFDWRNGEAYGAFPVMGSVISIPILLVLDATLPGLRTTTLHQYLIDNSLSSSTALQVQGITAAAIAALSAGVMFLIARQYLRLPYALLLVGIYAFATSIYSTASRGMWANGPSALMLSIALYLLILARRRPALVAWAALPVALAYMIRPTNGASVAAITIYVALRYRRYLLRYLLVASVPAAIFLFNNLTVYGSLLSPYFGTGRSGFGLQSTIPTALIDLLVSPRTGLFVYMPFLVLLPLAFILKSRQDGTESLDWLALTIVVLHWIICGFFWDWWGGIAFGTRYWTDMMPYLMYLMIPLLVALQERHLAVGRHRALAAALAAQVGLGVFIHYRGATSAATLNWNYVPTETTPGDFGRARDWSDPQFLRGLGDDLVMPATDELVIDRVAAAATVLEYGSAADGAIDLTISLPVGVTLAEPLPDDAVTQWPDGRTEVRDTLVGLGRKKLDVMVDMTNTAPGAVLGEITITGRQERRGREIVDIETISLVAGP